MFYREAGDFKTTYSADNQTFPIKIDRMGYYVALVVAFLIIVIVLWFRPSGLFGRHHERKV